MNRQEQDILLSMVDKPFINQRELADRSGYSIGVVNRALKTLVTEGYLESGFTLTDQSWKLIKESSPRSAVILAAGYGMRMVPINTEVPKGLLEVHGEPLIERLIKQLQEVGVYNIRVVVGFMKEQYEYLIDKFNIELVVNSQYAVKNNLHSLSLAMRGLTGTYVVPCDVRAESNLFSSHELYSWYMVSEDLSGESEVRVNRKSELVKVPDHTPGNAMIGISYIAPDQSEWLTKRLAELDSDDCYNDSFWETALYHGDRMMIMAKTVKVDQVVEINTYEQLRAMDENSNQLKSDALNVISHVFSIPVTEIRNIRVLKKGMTNRSFLFEVHEKDYIMRIPGEGTDILINRKQEAEVYQTIRDKGICDDIVYINPDNGYKITAFLKNSRVCDSENQEDLRKCMKRLRDFHNLELKVNHEFDIFVQLEFYESLWNGKPSVYKDYSKTKASVLQLKSFIDSHVQTRVLTHIDAIPDNFLFTEEGEIRLIDWEYSGMQDPHVDIAMFCIYALYDRKQSDNLIDLYFEGKCSRENRLKIYCYMAACGLLWSNWCEFKSHLGIEFGEYSLKQYRYAKDFSRIVREELDGRS